MVLEFGTPERLVNLILILNDLNSPLLTVPAAGTEPSSYGSSFRVSRVEEQEYKGVDG